MQWKNDEALFLIIREKLFTAVIGDVMDRLGYLHQFLPPYLIPLHPSMSVTGRAMPVLEADIDMDEALDKDKIIQKPFGLMLEALDDLKANEVYVCTGSSPAYALWGELMSIRAIKLGAAGAVVDGYSRDTRGILALNFPVFSRGYYAQDQGPRGQVIDFRKPVSIQNTIVNNGDIIVGDLDGLCIIPKEIEHEVIHLALEKVENENKVRKMLLEGMSTVMAFEKYGVM